MRGFDFSDPNISGERIIALFPLPVVQQYAIWKALEGNPALPLLMLDLDFAALWMDDEFRLYRMAREAGASANIASWMGHSGSTGSRRVYKCYICQSIVAQDSAKSGKTQRAQRAVEEHRRMHLAQAEKVGFSSQLK